MLDPPLLSWAKRPFSKGLQVQLRLIDSLPDGTRVWLGKGLSWWDRGTAGASGREGNSSSSNALWFEQNTSLQHNFCPSFSSTPNKRKKMQEVLLLGVPNPESKLLHKNQPHARVQGRWAYFWGNPGFWQLWQAADWGHRQHQVSVTRMPNTVWNFLGY